MILGQILQKPNAPNALVAGLIGHDLRLNLLSLNTLTSGLSEDFDAAIRIWEYGRRELLNHYLTGSSQASAQLFHKYEDTTFISCARSVENIFQELSLNIANKILILFLLSKERLYLLVL